VIVKTSTDNQRLYKLDLINLVDDAEQLVATLWGSLPEMLRSETEIAIELTISEDEQLDLIIGIPSHSEYEVIKHIARGQTDDLFYSVFDGIAKKFAQSRNSMKQDEINDFLEKAKAFVNYVNSGNISNADHTLRSMQKKLGEESIDSAGERRAELFINYGEYILNVYNGILTPEQSYEYKRLIEQLKEFVSQNNIEESESCCDRIDQYERDLKSWIWPIERVLSAARKISAASPSKAAQLEQEGRALIMDAKAGRNDAVDQRLKKIWQEVNNILEATLDTGKEFFLKK
jgi:hypothetical protein